MKLLTLIVAMLAAGGSARARQLVWDETRPELVRAYNVYDCAVIAPSAAWEFLATTSTNGCEVPFDSAQKFFTVTVVCFDGVEIPEIKTSSSQSIPGTRTPASKLLTPRTKQ